MLTRHTAKALLGSALLAITASASPATAHPHVFVTSKATVAYEGGKIIAIDHQWTFDEFYTAMAIQGLDANNDGIYSREELAELAKVNMEGLKEFEFFTFAKLAEAKLAFGPPVDAWLDHKETGLTLHFRLPLKEPLPAEPTGFAFSVSDPSFFIAFELAKGDAVTLGAGAPSGCKITLADTDTSANTPDNKTLTGALTEQFGAGAMGASGSKTAAVTCAKS
jgi:ABC-type uncharacterized transport system substrate-binding protein